MNAPSWINDTLCDFGHLMGLDGLRLNGSGVAGLEVENGLRFSFEYADGRLVVSAKVAMDASVSSLCCLLGQANPMVQGQPVRAYYLSKTGEGAFALALPEGGVKVHTLENAFQALWKAADYLRRNAGWQ